MFKRPVTLLLAGVAGLLAACSIPGLPVNDEVAPPTASDFQPVVIGEDVWKEEKPDVSTPTKFAPTLDFELQSLKAGEEPAVTINIYQTKSELEIKETHTLIENAGFRFDKLQVGQEVGYGKMEIGTPPKLTLDVSIRVTEAGPDTAQMSVKASSLIAKVYVADLQIKSVPGGLSIISIGNATKADDKNGVHTTPASARVIQTLYPGYVKLPTQPGPMRTRTVIISEPDPTNQVTGQKVFNETLTIQ